MAVGEDAKARSAGTIGDRVRAARERREWSRETLAFHAQVSWSAISQVESGRRRNLRLETLTSLAAALGVSVDYLVTGRASAPAMLEHRGLLYGSDEEFAAIVIPFLEEGRQRGEPALAVTTKRNIELVRDNLGGSTSEVRFADRSTWYRSPGSTLDKYRSFIDAVVDEGANWARIVGEITWEGLSENAIGAWGRYETVLNLTLASAPATIVCPYDTRVVGTELIDTACATHPELMDSDGASPSAGYSGLSPLLGDY